MKKTLKAPVRALHKRLDRLADSPALLDAAARFTARHLQRWHDATDWEVHGRDDLGAVVTGGQPVILATWHGRLAMSPWLWQPGWGPVTSLTSAARPGRIVAKVHNAFGIGSLPMHDRKANRAVSIQAARLVRQGHSLAFACDGPVGPVREMKRIPLDWSRLTGAPIWLWSYSVTRCRHLPSWDRMILPRPGGRGIMLYRPWGVEVPKKPSEEETEALRQRLGADLNALSLEADRAMGHDGLLC